VEEGRAHQTERAPAPRAEALLPTFVRLLLLAYAIAFFLTPCQRRASAAFSVALGRIPADVLA
jgi:hypothetical protein